MGMDVYGRAPTSREGEYFRNNVWWWRPLADYILRNHSAIACRCQYWHSNDGDGLDAKDAKALADALKADIANGKVQAWAVIRQAEIGALPNETCIHCAGTGVRNDKYVNGECNACHGAGSVRPFAENYAFNAENVEEFAKFCEASGGFEIR